VAVDTGELPLMTLEYQEQQTQVAAVVVRRQALVGLLVQLLVVQAS